MVRVRTLTLRAPAVASRRVSAAHRAGRPTTGLHGQAGARPPRICLRHMRHWIVSTQARTTAVLGLVLLSALPAVRAADWPMWGRTNDRNMYSPDQGLPASFDPGQSKPGSTEVDLATTKNVQWVARLGSQSYGNVVVAQGRVLVGTNNDPPRDPRHPGDRSLQETLRLVFDTAALRSNQSTARRKLALTGLRVHVKSGFLREP